MAPFLATRMPATHPISTRSSITGRTRPTPRFCTGLLVRRRAGREEEGPVSPARRGRGPARRDLGGSAARARARAGPLPTERADAAARRLGQAVRPGLSASHAAGGGRARGQGLSRHASRARRRRAGASRIAAARAGVGRACDDAQRAFPARPGEPWHRAESGGFLRNVVYGFNDGLTANFGLVAGVIGASSRHGASHRDRRRRRRV